MIECWKPIPDYEDLYQVSDRGRVRRIMAGRGTYAGRVLRPCDDTRGYPFVDLYRDGHRSQQRVHVLMAEAFFGPRPLGMEVNHKNGVKRDNRLTNLEYVTHGENLKHSYDVIGHEAPCGEDHGRAKLTAPIVKEIRRLYAKGGVTQRELAKCYGISEAQAQRIIHRKRWAHVA